MIEKFTAAEIEQLRKDLEEIDKKLDTTLKNYVVSNSYEKLRNCTINDWCVNAQEIEGYIYKICDASLHNFLFRKNDEGGGCRKENVTVVFPEIKENYASMFSEIVNVIEKYHKPFEAFSYDDACALAIATNKYDKSIERMVRFGDGELPLSVANILRRAQISQNKLLHMTDREILRLRGIGRSKLSAIHLFLEQIKQNKEEE